MALNKKRFTQVGILFNIYSICYNFLHVFPLKMIVPWWQNKPRKTCNQVTTCRTPFLSESSVERQTTIAAI